MMNTYTYIYIYIYIYCSPVPCCCSPSRDALLLNSGDRPLPTRISEHQVVLAAHRAPRAAPLNSLSPAELIHHSQTPEGNKTALHTYQDRQSRASPRSPTSHPRCSTPRHRYGQDNESYSRPQGGRCHLLARARLRLAARTPAPRGKRPTCRMP